MSKQNQHFDVDFTNKPVDAAGRKSNLSMFMVMLGFTFFSASMWVGQNLANGLDFNGFIWALLLGGLILAAYTGALGWIGAESGMTLEGAKARLKQNLSGVDSKMEVIEKLRGIRARLVAVMNDTGMPSEEAENESEGNPEVETNIENHESQGE